MQERGEKMVNRLKKSRKRLGDSWGFLGILRERNPLSIAYNLCFLAFSLSFPKNPRLSHGLAFSLWLLFFSHKNTKKKKKGVILA